MEEEGLPEALIEVKGWEEEERFYCHFLMGEEVAVISDYFSHLDLWEEEEGSALFGRYYFWEGLD